MASQITSLLKYGWENLWKNSVLWLFSSLILAVPLFRLIIPFPNNDDLASLPFNFIASVANIYFTFLSIAGAAFVAYCIAISNPVDSRTAFQAAKKLFWRVLGISFLILVLLIPYICIVGFSFRQLLQIDTRNNIIFIQIFLSFFTAMWYFPIAEAIINDSKIGESLKRAWTVFIRNFVSLALIGLLLLILLWLMGISISMVMMLVQNNYDVSALTELDLINPHWSFPNDNFYNLAISFVRMMWQTYGISIYTLAYLKYSSATMKKHVTANPNTA